MHLTTRTSIFFQLIKFYSRQNKQENQNLMIQVRTRESARDSVKETISAHVHKTLVIASGTITDHFIP